MVEVPDKEILTIREDPRLGSVNVYRSVPGTVSLNLTDTIRRAESWQMRVRDCSRSVERAASRVKTGTVFRSHSPGVVAYVAQVRD